MRRIALFPLFLLFASLGLCAQSPQVSATPAETQAPAYPNTSEGLQSLIGDVLSAVKAGNKAREAALIRSLLVPEDSTWFTDEYGPGFGASLAAAYRAVRPRLEEEIRTVYEGNVRLGLAKPKILRYTDPEKVDAPIDQYLNSMDEIVPLYATASRGDRQFTSLSLNPDGRTLQPASGDLPGYFIYDRGGFRFVPSQILMKLPDQRPVRIHLDMNVMRSKLITDANVKLPQEAIRKHISGKVTVEVIVDLSGNVKEPRAVEGDPVLCGAVIDAVKKWKFAPTELDGDPVEVVLRIPYVFNIR